MDLCRPMPDLTESELHAIAEADWHRNYSGTPYTVEDLLFAIADWRKCGLPMGFYDGVILAGRPVGLGIFEFHSVNGASLKTLIKATRMLLAQLSDDFLFATTYYDNPRVEGLAKHLQYPFTTNRVDQGPQRRYETFFDLRK